MAWEYEMTEGQWTGLVIARLVKVGGFAPVQAREIARAMAVENVRENGDSWYEPAAAVDEELSYMSSDDAA